MTRPPPPTSGAISLLALFLALGALAIWWLSRGVSERDSRRIQRITRAIIGNDKAAISAVFGPPRASAGFGAIAPAILVAADLLDADTWYYSLGKRTRRALVVRFDRGIAREAQLLCPPKKSFSHIID